MKTTKFYLALSFALIMTGMNAFYSHASTNMTGTSGSLINKNDITYVVNIKLPDNLAGFAGDYNIMITDERGNLVDRPQLFRLGLNTYTFHERGIAAGSRTARMETTSTGIGNQAYIFLPSTLAGPFLSGKIYNFILIPEKIK